MTIKVGDSLPETTFMTMSAEGPKPAKTAEVFGGKKVALFAVPGAYTPTCHKQHMAGFVRSTTSSRRKGFDAVACTAVNDIFVLTNWAKDSKADGKIQMLADGSAEFAKKIGLEVDLGARGMGVRSKRYSMIVENGVVKVAERGSRFPATTSPALPPCARWPESAHGALTSLGLQRVRRPVGELSCWLHPSPDWLTDPI